MEMVEINLSNPEFLVWDILSFLNVHGSTVHHRIEIALPNERE